VDDAEIHRNIEGLVAEEHGLWQREETRPGGLHDDESRRLQELKVTLDRCWDLLRQRRASRQYGRDPDTARVRDPATVERYEQ
jgi:hypothetical protein